MLSIATKEKRECLKHEAAKRAKEYEKTNHAFESEMKISLRLTDQMMKRLALMENAILRIVSVVRIQQAFRRYIACQWLKGLKLIKFLSLWFLKAYRIRKLNKAKKRIKLFFAEYSDRQQKKIFVKKVTAACFIVSAIFNYQLRKRAVSQYNLLIQLKAHATAAMIENQKTEKAELK